MVVPSAMWGLALQGLTAAGPAMAPGHIGLGPGLIDEHQTPGVKPALMRRPSGPAAGHVGAILFAGVQSFF